MTLRIAWLGHSTVVLDVDGVRLVADPLLRPHAGLLRRAGPHPDPRTWRGADAVLVSHLHHDHAELGSLRLLPGVPVLAAADNARWLARKGIASAVGMGEAWLPVGAEGRVRVRPTRAVHGDRPMPHRPNAALGLLVEAPNALVWLAGDTELFPEMTGIPALGGRPDGVDVAVVPVWGWGPRLSGGHLTPETAATACARVGARYAIPVHWGTLHPPGMRRRPRGWLESPGPAFADAVRREAPGCEPVVLAPGESWELPDGDAR